MKKYVLKSPDLSVSSKIDYRKELNDAQYAVVTEAEGPSLVLAGAGSGKTRTLIYRVAYLIERGVRPEEILLVTFTNKAALEMKNRVEALLQTQAKGLWCGTFHHIGNRVLRMYAAEAGLFPDFGILDDEDSRDLVKACIKSLEIPTEGRFPKPAVVQAILSFAANAQKKIPEVVDRHYSYLLRFAGQFERVARLYAEKKGRSNNLDYDDLLIKWVELLQKSQRVREKLCTQFRYCLVDEYQDTNRLQQELVRVLSGHHKNILIVGDDAQSIYSFRAAEIKNILQFPEVYEGAKIFKLETNYRSTKPILDLANESIKHNVHQFPKKLKSVKGEGALPQFAKVRDARQEAAFVAQRIEESAAGGVDFSEIAVLFRARYQAAELELELARRGIPYVIRGGVRFFEQAHIKDVLSYLKILLNPSDEIAWTRALSREPGIGSGYAQKIFALAAKENSDLHKAASNEFGSDFPIKVREGLAAFKKILRKLLKEDLKEHPDVLIQEVLDGGYRQYALLNFQNARDRLEDLKELVSFAHTYKDLKDFLADVTLRESFKGETVVDVGEAPDDELVLSTIHQAKGLEWKTVFVIGLAEGKFPHEKSLENEEEIEEERRLFYVAVTRAKEDLTFVHPMTHFDYQAGTVLSRPSIFIEELPHSVYDEVEVEEEGEEKTIYID